MPHIITFKSHIDPRGSLTVAEKELPFDVKRIYYIYNVPEDSVRGKHRHRKTAQIFICVSGSCVVDTRDKDGKLGEFLLDSPGKGLFLNPSDWHQMRNFKLGTVLLALASEPYSADDYIYED